jgi:anion-transporting  ArsA/GET3 family ATPase
MASAIAVRASQLGRRTLVLTVDPAKRLATALGLDISSSEDHKVPLAGEGQMSAAVIDSKKVFDQFILTHGKQADVINRIMKNRLYQQMSTTLAGSQEFTALERLLQAVESEKYDLVVLDTPPTKHAVDFLTAPQRINALFQDTITRWFMNPGEKPLGFFGKIVGHGTRVALKSLETLTGAQFIEELIDFFSAVRSVQSELRDRSEKVRELLTGSKTKFVVVTSFDAAKLMEAKYLQGELSRLGYKLEGAIINRAFPEGVNDHELVKPADVESASYEKVLAFYKSFKEYHATRYQLYEEFSKGLPGSVTVVRVPEYQKDVHGLADLEALATVL